MRSSKHNGMYEDDDYFGCMKAGGWGGGEGRTKRVKQRKYLYICLHKYAYCVYKNILSYKKSTSRVAKLHGRREHDLQGDGSCKKRAAPLIL